MFPTERCSSKRKYCLLWFYRSFTLSLHRGPLLTPLTPPSSPPQNLGPNQELDLLQHPLLGRESGRKCLEFQSLPSCFTWTQAEKCLSSGELGPHGTRGMLLLWLLGFCICLNISGDSQNRLGEEADILSQGSTRIQHMEWVYTGWRWISVAGPLWLRISSSIFSPFGMGPDIEMKLQKG